ncbi:copper resistance protein CopC [Staphylococcus caprae]|uniref:copper resistance CopC/CopD family protein n=1 Tax=Staphylococcus caprae TaxID=29380 RepID=UPI00254A6896|nr:copper resistance protein CopC [Staphylococcus caprae]MDK6297946.1 copper resistance protein CopC [Staphylococcus caprae]MDK7233565.1 copper resistance protein CopC [Staphylococcus caprae]
MLLRNKMSKYIIALVIIFFMTLVPAFEHQASAHATLEKTTPQEKGVVKEKPEEIQLEYNEPVNAKYSNITLYNDKGKKISEVKPTTSGWSKTLEFPGDQIAKGTNTVEWHAISADGHEVSNKFEFSVGKVTAKNVDTSDAFYAQPSFWFGVFRYLTEGATIILVGLFWVNGIAKRRGLRQFNVLPKQVGVTWIMAMTLLMSMIVYMMTLTSDVLNDILTLKADVIMQFPYIISSIALIVLFILMTLKDMEKVWYWLVSFAMILAIAMSGHAWSQHIPLWSIIIRTLHLAGMTLWLGALIYLICYAKTERGNQLTNVRQMLLRTNITAVAILIISGVLMAIDETNILTIWSHIQAWTIFMILKVIGTLIMMILGFYQTTKALGKRNKVNQPTLYIELIIGIALIFAGVMMSQINIPG